MKLRALLLTSAVTLSATTVAFANPLDTFGFGSRGTALGGAMSADVSDFSANYYNPAGLARAKGLELSVGYFRADHFLKTNGEDNGVDPVKGISGGIVAPGKILGIPFAFGLGLHLPDDRISRVRALRQEQPRWELYDNRNQRLYLAANLAVSPVKWLQIGGGLSFMSSTEGRLDITGQANLFKPSDSPLRHEVDADLTAIRYPQAGVRVALSDRVALALVYRGQFSLSLNLRARLQGDISGLTTAYYNLVESSINAFLPQQLVFGQTWKLSDRITASADITWVNWSAYVAPVAHLDVDLAIPPPAGGWPAGITPPSVPAPTHVVPLVMHDRVVPHLGVEMHAINKARWGVDVRLGYEFAKSPIAAQTGLTNYIDRDRHSVSFGAGFRLSDFVTVLPGDLLLDAHLVWSVMPTETTIKADPADFVGDYTAGGHLWNAGATLTARFR
jgi:long-subunit fatty acid transport protein